MNFNGPALITDEIQRLQNEITAKREELLQLRRQTEPEPISDYSLLDWEGREVKLSDLFGDKEDLIVVHNMGRRCVYCTMWADGFNGVHHHLSDRAAFVVVSPDEPGIQKKFATGRGWSFRMLSGHGGEFIKDMGYVDDEDGSYWPGISTFWRDPEGKIFRISADVFGPGDPYCGTWHILDLLKHGDNGWEPKYKY